jgi:hypothetical protein
MAAASERMDGFAGIIQSAFWLTLRSWLALAILIILRVGLAIAGFLPFFLFLAMLIRSILAAPIDPSSGHTDIGAWWTGVWSQPATLAALAGILTALSLIRFVIETLLDGGVFGSMGQAVRTNRAMTLGDLLNDGLRLFDRTVIFRFMAELFSLVLKLAVLSAPLIWVWTAGANTLTADKMVEGLPGLLSVVLALWAFGELLIYFAYLSAMASASLDDVGPSLCLRNGFTFMSHNLTKILVITTFWGVLGTAWSLLRLLGSVWFLKLMELKPSSQLLGVASNAWDLGFALLAALLWFFTLASFFLLYARFHPQDETQTGPGVAIPATSYTQ